MGLQRKREDQRKWVWNAMKFEPTLPIHIIYFIQFSHFHKDLNSLYFNE